VNITKNEKTNKKIDKIEMNVEKPINKNKKTEKIDKTPEKIEKAKVLKNSDSDGLINQSRKMLHNENEDQ